MKLDLNNIDWEATGAIWGGVGSLMAGVAVLLSYFKARSSFNEWRDQELFREDRKLAIEALSAFEEGKFAIDSIRSPMSMAAEQAAVDQRLREAETKQNIVVAERDRDKHMKRLTVHLRIEHHSDTWKRLNALLPVTKAVFGSRIRDQLLEIFKARQKIYAAAEMFRHDLAPESIRKYESIIWPTAIGDEIDPVAPAIEAAERILQETLTPFIRPADRLKV